MDDTTYPLFLALAEEKGIPRKLLYTPREVSKVTGVPYTTVIYACDRCKLRCSQPSGTKGRRLMRPEWIDEWIEEGTHGKRHAAA